MQKNDVPLIRGVLAWILFLVACAFPAGATISIVLLFAAGIIVISPLFID
jgi:hypothetical protein